MRISIVLLALVAFACAAPVSAQVSTAPMPLGPAIDTGLPLDDLAALTALYNGGRWDDLQIKAQAVLTVAAARAAGLPNGRAIAEGLDFTKSYVIVVWIGADPFGKTILARAVVHAPAAAEPFSADLPGVGVKPDDPHVYEAFLSRGARGRLISVYASSRDKDPIADTLPAFVQAIASPLFATFGALAGSLAVKAAPKSAVATEAAPAKPQPPPVSVTVSRVGLPFARASIKWKALAKEPVDVDAFWDATDALVQDLTFHEVPNSPCARLVAATLGDAIKSASAAGRCASPTATAAGCRASFDAAIRDAIAQGLEDRACAAASKDDLSAVEKLDDRFREFAAASMTTAVEGELSFKNRPLTHWTLGAGTGVLARGSLRLPRVALKNDVLIADPLPRVVTSAFVNWSPAGYDAAFDTVSAAERTRPFAGVTITPDFGMIAGVNVLLTRGIGVTAGAVLLFAKGAAAEDIGKAPTHADQPYALSFAGGVVIGVSYNFK